MSGAAEHPLVAAPLESRLWSLPEGVRLVEANGVSPGVTYPRGFVASGVSAGIKESGRPDVGLLAAASDCRAQVTSAAVFTSNAFAAAPIVVSQRETKLSKLCAVVANSGSANACTGGEGLVVARGMQAACAAAGSRLNRWEWHPPGSGTVRPGIGAGYCRCRHFLQTAGGADFLAST